MGSPAVSTWVERLRRRASRGGDAGFTLLEIMVAMVLLALIALALVPVLISSARATTDAKRATTAKNLAQQLIDTMRNLPFHVDAQNGPFLDLLDDYYTNIKTTSTTLPSGGTGIWCQSSSVPGSVSCPPVSGLNYPYYQATFTNAFNTTGFTQTVYTQFLTSAQPLPAVVPATTLTNMSYDSSTVGHDQPPSLLLGVTIVTAWQGLNGVAKTSRVYTEVTDNGTDSSLILSQSRSTALLVRSKTYDGQQLEGAVGVVKIDGSLGNTSNASSYAQGAYITIVGGDGVDSPPVSAVSPPNPSGSSSPVSTGYLQWSNTSQACNGGSFGPTQLSDVTSNTAGGLPVGPSDVATPGTAVQASLQANGGSGSGCNGFFFTNQTAGAPATDPTLQLDPSMPMVNITDLGGNGSLANASGSIAATSAIGNPGAVSSKAAVAYTSRVQIFRGLQFVPQNQSVCSKTGASTGTDACGNGLVNIFLTSASMNCASATTTTASYNGYLTYYTSTGWHSVALSWSSSSGPSTDPLAGINMAQTVTTYNGNPVPLSAYISSWSTARAISTGTDGISSLPSIVAVNTAPTRADDPGSSIGVGVGNLSCVATDNR
jgi:prepilin-type N-terminal cleavage/methylation domain-containing protein